MCSTVKITSMGSQHIEVVQGQPWFPSGDVILLSADNVGFRVHQELIETHSLVFMELFASSVPEVYSDGCKIYEVGDTAEELANLLAVVLGGE